MREQGSKLAFGAGASKGSDGVIGLCFGGVGEEPSETCGAVTDGTKEAESVVGLGAGAQAWCQRRLAEECDAKTPTTGRAKGVATDETACGWDMVVMEGVKETCRQCVHIGRGCAAGRDTEGEGEGSRGAAHGSDVAEIGSEAAVGSVIEAHDAEVEVHVFVHGIAGNEQGGVGHVEACGVIADTDSNGLTRGEGWRQASDQGVFGEHSASRWYRVER